MSADLLIIFGALALLAVLVGYAVRCALRDRATAVAHGLDEAIDRAMRNGGVLTKGRLRELREGLPDALDMLANSLSAGLTLPQALRRNLEHLPPALAAEFAHVLYDMSLGYSIGGAFDNLARRIRHKDFQMVAIASKIGVEHGGRLHENFHSLSGILRSNLAFQRELKAMTTEGRMQAIVMSCLPVALMLILSFIQPDMMKPMFTTLAGWLTLGLLAGMLSIAFVWIRGIVSIDV